MRGGKAAVDGDRLAVDVACGVGSEEQGDRGDLLRLAAALHRVEAADALLLAARARPFVDLAGHAGFDQAGADGVDADVGAGELGRGDLHQVDQPRLRRRISRAAGARAKPGDRRGADDRAAAPRLHVRRRIFDRQERADQVDAQDLLPVGAVLLEDAREAAGNAGIGEDDVDAAMVGDDRLDERRDLVFRAGVERATPSPAAASAAMTVAPSLRNSSARGLADARSGAGYQRDLVVEDAQALGSRG